jgi:hypothetical protein
LKSALAQNQQQHQARKEQQEKQQQQQEKNDGDPLMKLHLLPLEVEPDANGLRFLEGLLAAQT